MKKFIALTALLVSISVSSLVQAQSFCGGNPVFNADISSNNRPWNVSCCPEGYRVQGIACSDLPPDQDLADGCSAVCRSIAKGNRMIASADFQRAPDVKECKNNEVMSGILCKDMSRNSKGDDDVTDGCTPVCQKPGSDSLRIVPKDDIAGNPREPNQVSILLPNRVVGIACKDVNKGTSDRLDSCTIIED